MDNHIYKKRSKKANKITTNCNTENNVNVMTYKVNVVFYEILESTKNQEFNFAELSISDILTNGRKEKT